MKCSSRNTPRHAVQLARQAAQGGPVRLYACGGDGTLNEVLMGARRVKPPRWPVFPAAAEMILCAISAAGSGFWICRT